MSRILLGFRAPHQDGGFRCEQPQERLRGYEAQNTETEAGHGAREEGPCIGVHADRQLRSVGSKTRER